MKSLLAAFTAVLIALSFSACAVKPQQPAKAATTSVPAWAVDSTREGYITGLGVGRLKTNKKNAEKFRDRAAQMMAEANLAKQFEIHVDSNTYVKAGNKQASDVRVDTVQTSITTSLGQHQKIELERWVDPQTGTLYLLLGIKLAD